MDGAQDGADDDLGRVLLRTATLTVLLFQSVAAHAGLGVVDAQCAVLLGLDGPRTPGQLARAVGVSTGGAITAVIDRLEAAGLARRTRDPGDRRRVLVAPVPGALDRLAAHTGPAAAALAAATPPALAPSLRDWADALNAALPDVIEATRPAP